MAHRVPINIRVDRFEGPLDLLLYLIQSHELDVSKIAISRITDQYLAYVRLMQELDFDVASDFLLMAATLIQWKSKSLLPVDADPNAVLADGDEAMSPEELLRQLLEHQRFLDAGRELARLPLLGDDVYQRPMTRKPTEKVWKAMEPTTLALTFQDLLVKERKRTTILKKETVSLAEKIVDFADRMEVGRVVGMRTLLRDLKSRPETVVTFLASLELGRLKKMRLHQEKAYEEIYVQLLESIKGFDTELARGFDAVEEKVGQAIAEAAAHGEGHAAGTAAAAALGVAPPDAPPGIGGAEVQLADPRGAESSLSDGGPPSPSDADRDRTENAAGDGDPARAGLAGRDSGDPAFDLESFGEDRGPDLRSVLAGTDDGDHGGRDARGGLAAVPQPGAGNPGASDGRRNADPQRGRDES